MKKAIVTGADGFIGSALVRALCANGYQVYAIVKDKSKCHSLNSLASKVKVFFCDFLNYHTIAFLVGEPIDCFIHLAWGGVSGKESQDVILQSDNIKASITALDQAHRLNAQKFIFAGSSYQYRMEPVIRKDEIVYRKKNLYGKTKEATTILLKAISLSYNIDFNSILFTNVFGVGDYSKRSTNTLILQLLQQEPVRLIPGDHKHDWIYIDDAVNGIIDVMEKGRDGVSYYIGNRQLKTFREIITELRDILSPNTSLEFGYYPDDGYIDYSSIDLDHLYVDTGFECKSNFQNSILKTAEWIKKLEQENI